VKKHLAIATLLLLSIAVMLGQTAHPAPIKATDARFIAADIFIDSGASSLAAWQVEFTGSVPQGSVELVGVEGGQTPAFAKPAYYDPEALSHNRVILAAYSLDKALPTGKSRVARLHLRVLGAVDQLKLETSLTTAADAGGTQIKAQATTTIVEGDR
jgi:hypothetical protein